MKILIFGRGVIGCIYGWAFQAAGQTVHFYVRPGRAQDYGSSLKMQLLDARRRPTGVLVDDTWSTHLREDLPADHDYDLIIVSVQHYRFPEVAEFLASRTSNATVLIFNNLWAEPQEATSALPSDQLAWGFPMAGGGFDAEGVLRGSLFGSVQFGTFGTPLSQRESEVRQLFKRCGFKITEQTDFRGWLFIHFATNAGVHAEALQSSSGWALDVNDYQNAIHSVRALLGVVESRGVDLSKHFAVTAPFRLPPWLASRVLYFVMRSFKVVRVVLECHSNPEELRATCRDALAEARRLGVTVERLESIEPLFALPA